MRIYVPSLQKYTFNNNINLFYLPFENVFQMHSGEKPSEKSQNGNVCTFKLMVSGPASVDLCTFMMACPHDGVNMI